MPNQAHGKDRPALLMLHWQNSVADLKGVWGKNLFPQIEKNNAIENAKSVLKSDRNKKCCRFS